MSGTRRRGECAECHRVMEIRARGMCPRCVSRAYKQGHGEHLALTGGRWVAVRGVQRWVSDTPEPYPIACDTCDATLAEPCRTPAGTARMPHAERIMRCMCGVTPKPGQTYCTDCRGEARRATWRDSRRRGRAA